MAQTESQNRTDEVAVAGLTLAEAIEANASNRFSGCLTVQYGGSIGLIFFRDGEIVHAEQGGKSGPEAFYDIMEWRATRFSLEANMASTRRTIQKSAQELLTAAQQVVEERRIGSGMTGRFQASSIAPRDTAVALLERLRGINGVASVVLTAKDGSCIGDGSTDGEALAGQAAYLSMVANHLGTIFRAGAVHSAVIQGSAQNFLLLAGKNQYLSVLIQPNAQIRVVESEIRKVLTSRR